MQIGIYSPRRSFLEEWREAAEDFVRSACLELDLHAFSSHDALMNTLTGSSLDVLFYDTALSDSLEEQVWEVMRIIPNCSLVLLGDDTRHALFGYAVRAVGYLLTPLDPEDLIETLARLIRERMEAKEQFLPIKIEGVWSRLSMDHIVYLESSRHSMIFHMDDGRDFRVSASYRDYQPILSVNPHFCRCHKSYMVNMRHVTGLEQSGFRLDNGEQVSISRPYRQDARCYFACYTTSPYEKQAPKAKRYPTLENGAAPAKNDDRVKARGAL